MVVQSIALPKVPGGTREPESSIVSIAAPAPAVDAGRGASFAPVVVTVLVAAQVAWLALLGYGVLQFIL